MQILTLPDLFTEFIQKLVLLLNIEPVVCDLIVDDIRSQLLGEFGGKVVVLWQLFRVGNPPVQQLLALVDLWEVSSDFIDDVAHVDDADHLDHQHCQYLPRILRSDVPVADCEHGRAGKVERKYVPVAPAVVKCGNSDGPVDTPVALWGHIKNNALNHQNLYKNMDEYETTTDKLSDLNLVSPVRRDLNLQQNIELLESSV